MSARSSKKDKGISIKNKKISFEYELLEEYIAGIELVGTEIKSIREKKASIEESFCQIKNKELYIVNMYIAPYGYGSHFNHTPRRQRKLLVNKREILRIEKKLKGTSLTVVPKKLFINDKNYAKLQLFIVKGKKKYDKREAIKKKDIEIDNKRDLKYK